MAKLGLTEIGETSGVSGAGRRGDLKRRARQSAPQALAVWECQRCFRFLVGALFPHKTVLVPDAVL